jgi:hypothetical protein
MSEGYIYCLVNDSMPDIIKVGMTQCDINETLSLANNYDMYKPPTPYKLEIVKCMDNFAEKYNAMCSLLTHYAKQIESTEFFKISIKDLKLVFDLLPGYYLNDEHNDTQTNEKVEKKVNKRCREMSKCFTDGQKIRHVINYSIWYGVYNQLNDCIIRGDDIYTGKSPLNQFVSSHYKSVHPTRTSANAWSECECEINGEWISTFDLPEIV